MKKILFLANLDTMIYNVRLELVKALISKGHKVLFACPFGDRTEEMISMGCKHVNVEMSRHGTNPFKEIKILKAYKKIIKEEKPDVVLTYSIKPNVYGGMACKSLKIPYIANVTGLGDSIENGGLMSKIMLFLYKKGIKKAKKVFFQNAENQEFFVKKKIVRGNYELLPGSGVNLENFSYLEYPNDKEVRFLYAGRITKDKGVEELAKAVEYITTKYENVYFDIVGGLDKGLNPFTASNKCVLHGHQREIKKYLEKAHAVILPSYHEGMANVLLEGSACGRPILATVVSGCKETFNEGITGFGFEPKSVDSLILAIEKFLELSFEEKVAMGKEGRKKMEKEFDRNIVVSKYLEEINQI